MDILSSDPLTALLKVFQDDCPIEDSSPPAPRQRPPVPAQCRSNLTAESAATDTLSQDAESATFSPRESSPLLTAKSAISSPEESHLLVTARSAVPSPGESSSLVMARSVVPSPGESSSLVTARSAVPSLEESHLLVTARSAVPSPREPTPFQELTASASPECPPEVVDFPNTIFFGGGGYPPWPPESPDPPWPPESPDPPWLAESPDPPLVPERALSGLQFP